MSAAAHQARIEGVRALLDVVHSVGLGRWAALIEGHGELPRLVREIRVRRAGADAGIDDGEQLLGNSTP